jgi:multidrug resistance efflux pump
MMDVHIQKRRQLWRGWKLWLMLATPCLAIVIWYWRLPPTVTSNLWLAEVKFGPVNTVMSGTGKIKPAHTRWLVAQRGGVVDEIFVLPGSRFKAGDSLLKLSNAELNDAALVAELSMQEVEAELLNLKASLRAERLQQQQQLQTIENALRKASLQQKAYQRLVSQGIVSSITMENANIDVEDLMQQRSSLLQALTEVEQVHSAKISAQNAKLTLAKRKRDMATQLVAELVVRAPADGTLQQLQPDLAVGKYLAAGSPMAEMSASQQWLAAIQLPTIQSAAIRLGMPATVVWQDKTLSAIVSRIDPNANADMVDVDLELSDRNLSIPAGAPVQASIHTQASADLMHVPRSPTMSANAQLQLYRQDPTDPTVLQRVTVATGELSRDVVIIKSGLKPGDRVLMEPLPVQGTPAKVRWFKNSDCLNAR